MKTQTALIGVCYHQVIGEVISKPKHEDEQCRPTSYVDIATKMVGKVQPRSLVLSIPYIPWIILLSNC